MKSGDKPPTKSHKKDDTPNAVSSDLSRDPVKKVVKTTTVKDMLRAKRDNLRNMVEGGGVSVSSADDGSGSGSSDDESDTDDDDAEEVEDGDDEKMDTDAPTDSIKTDGLTSAKKVNAQLPSNLPDALVANINRLTASAKTSSGSKSNFFDSANTELLYQ